MHPNHFDIDNLIIVKHFSSLGRILMEMLSSLNLYLYKITGTVKKNNILNSSE